VPPALFGRGGPGGRGFGFGGGGGFGGGFGTDTASLSAAIRYVESHGGGTIGVSSQSSAADAILSSDANVAGVGGFSGRESSVTASWIAAEVRSGRLSWLVADGTQSVALPGDTRTASQSAYSIVERVAPKVTLTTGTGTTITLYDLKGEAGAILRAAGAG
jgi:hypothetical protein